MTARAKDKYTPRLQSHYNEVVLPELMKKYGYTNRLQAPRLEKIVINMGVGEAVNDSKKTKNAADQLALIAGQHPVITKARKAISTYKLRSGLGIGCKVTLRREKMYEFLDRSSMSPCRAFVTSVASRPRALMDRATMPWALRSRSCSPKLISTRSTKFAGWILLFVRRPQRMTKP
jgi:LSU ribosomal protein L5P